MRWRKSIRKVIFWCFYKLSMEHDLQNAISCHKEFLLIGSNWEMWDRICSICLISDCLWSSWKCRMSRSVTRASLHKTTIVKNCPLILCHHFFLKIFKFLTHNALFSTAHFWIGKHFVDFVVLDLRFFLRKFTISRNLKWPLASTVVHCSAKIIL